MIVKFAANCSLHILYMHKILMYFSITARFWGAARYYECDSSQR